LDNYFYLMRSYPSNNVRFVIYHLGKGPDPLYI
jgi:hypothetical protein